MSIASILSPNKRGAGAASLLALTSLAAHADVIRVDGLNQNVWPQVQTDWTGFTQTAAVDVDHNGTTDVSLTNTFTYYGRSYIMANYYGLAYDRSVTISGQGVGSGAVAAGTLIGPSLTTSPTSTLDRTTNTTAQVYKSDSCNSSTKAAPGTGGPCGSMYKSVVTGHYSNDNIGDSLLLPFQFSNDQQTQYGWLDVKIQDSTAGSLRYSNTQYIVTLNGYGYDNSGAAVAAGAAAFTSPVPEPSSLLMLATGLAGLAAYRRKGRARGAAGALPA